ncbi:MAG: hypothetical protein BMS9Abin32_544 [Gammaproteobacteria bacterium]|nr:MAG: hypothetical protein BMS9Abin32_544 [Gammaproteobacteria bacterium]
MLECVFEPFFLPLACHNFFRCQQLEQPLKKPMKAALLSGLVFPGLGHLFLKSYVRGIVLAGAALAGLYFLIARTMEMAYLIADQIQSGAVPLDATGIAALMSAQESGGAARSANIAAAVLVVAWLIGIVDAYRAGRIAQRLDESSTRDTESGGPV